MAVLRLLIRVLSNESDAEYNASVFLSNSYTNNPTKEEEQDELSRQQDEWQQKYNRLMDWTTRTGGPSSSSSSSSSLLGLEDDADHPTRRPHLQYSVARFQCTWMMMMTKDDDTVNATNDPSTRGFVDNTNNSNETTPNNNYSSATSATTGQSMNHDSWLAVQTVLSIWESVAMERLDHPHRILLAPLARLLGLLATAGLTPHTLRRIMVLAQQQQQQQYGTVQLLLQDRLTLLRALKTAAIGAARSPLLPKSSPRHFFCFGGTASGLQRTISGLATWPFRNDFGMALWFRVERFVPSSSSLEPILLSVRTDDGGGIVISIVPLEKGGSNSSSTSSSLTDACTIAISIYDSDGDFETPSHRVIVKGGCLLLPRLWYHVVVRHTRSRLKGVFSLSTRQQVTVMLDGKPMLTESLSFPRIAGADFADDSAGASLLMTTLRRNAVSSSINLTIKLGSCFDGQTGALHIFNDNVSDATFRALYEMTGGSGAMLKRNHSFHESWNAKRSDLVRKSRVLEISAKNDDAEETVLHPRRNSSFRRQQMIGKVAAVLDLADGDEHDENDLPVNLQKSLFGSKVFITWDPRRTSGSLALELHVGAHVTMEGVFSWGFNGAQDVISSIGGIQSLIPLFRSCLCYDVERVWSISAGGELQGTSPLFDIGTVASTISELIRVLNAFLQDHNDNARELLRCGGIDVIEQLLYSCKKLAMGKGNDPSIFGALNLYPRVALELVESMLKLLSVCSNNVGLETKIFSRLVFNIPLWLGGCNQIPGVGLHLTLLPILSSFTKTDTAKVRECIGVKDMVHALHDYQQVIPRDSLIVLDFNIDRLQHMNQMLDPSILLLTAPELLHVSRILLGMIFAVIASGASSRELSSFLNFITFALDAECNDADPDSFLARENQQSILESACTVLLLLLQIRPNVSGLFESFARSCGGVQGGASWILTAMVDSPNDIICALGVRCVAAYLDVTVRGADLPLSLGSLLQHTGSNSDVVHDVSSSVRRASTRITQLAKGLASSGPTVRTVAVPPSKLTARVVVKVRMMMMGIFCFSDVYLC